MDLFKNLGQCSQLGWTEICGKESLVFGVKCRTLAGDVKAGAPPELLLPSVPSFHDSFQLKASASPCKGLHNIPFWTWQSLWNSGEGASLQP